MAEIIKTSLSSTFSQGVTPATVTGYTLSCSPSMGNTFYLNIHSNTGRTLTYTSNVNWLHIINNKTSVYTANNFTSVLVTFTIDFNGLTTQRSGLITITPSPSDATILATSFTVTQGAKTPDLMTETELNDYLVYAIMNGVASTSGVSGTSGKNGSSGSSGTSGSI